MRVGDDLHLDVAAVLDVRLAEHRRVAERGRGLVGGELDLGLHVRDVADDPHAPTTAAGRRLHQDGQVGSGHGGGRDLLEHRYAVGGHELLRADLGAHLVDRLGAGTDPGQPRLDDPACEVGVLGQEAVAGVNRVGPRAERRLDHQVAAEVRLGRGVAGQGHGDVGLGDEPHRGIRVGVHRHGLDPEVPAGPEHPPRDLAPVGDEKPVDGGHVVPFGVPVALFTGERSGGVKNVMG